MRHSLLAAVVVILATPAAIAAPKPPQQRAEAFNALIACRAIADREERFACLDRTSGALEQAATRGEIVVVDRKQIRETKKTLFGLDLPNLSLFGDDKGEEIKSVDGVVASATQDGDGRWIVRMEDGALWRQIDSNVLGLRPKKGMEAEIRRGAISNFMMRLGGQPGIRVRRSN